MKKIKAFFKNENGAIAVMVALCLTALLGFTALSVDMGMLYYQKSKLQTAVDSAALAAASDLPDTTKAKATAKKYVEKNGFTEGDVTVSFSDENTVVNVEDVHPVQTTFANILGVSEMDIACDAAAKITKKSSGPSVFDYLIFSEQSFGFQGSFTLHGSVRSNGNINVDTAKSYIYGNFEAGGTVDYNKWTVNLGDSSQVLEHLEPLEMPDFSGVVRQVIPTDPVFDIAAHPGILVVNSQDIEKSYVVGDKKNKSITFPKNTDVYYNGSWSDWRDVNVYGDLYVNGSYNNSKVTTTTGSIYVNGAVNSGRMVLLSEDSNLYAVGDIKMDGSVGITLNGGYVYSAGNINQVMNFAGDGCIFAQGNITLKGDNTKITASRPLTIYSVNGDIAFTNRSEVSGIIYAPNGDCTISGGNSIFKGSIVAKTVRPMQSGMQMMPPDVDFPFDPPGSTINHSTLVK